MLEPISEDIFLVQGMNKGRFPFSHSILIFENENKTVLIDTGCGLEILKELKKKYNISYIINSHTHPDHSAGNWLFKDRPIYVPEEGFNTSGNLVALSERLAEERGNVKEWVAMENMRIPMGRMGMPEDIAYGILYLASDESSYVTGIELVIDGGRLVV